MGKRKQSQSKTRIVKGKKKEQQHFMISASDHEHRKMNEIDLLKAQLAISQAQLAAAKESQSTKKEENFSGPEAQLYRNLIQKTGDSLADPTAFGNITNKRPAFFPPESRIIEDDILENFYYEGHIKDFGSDEAYFTALMNELQSYSGTKPKELGYGAIKHHAIFYRTDGDTDDIFLGDNDLKSKQVDILAAGPSLKSLRLEMLKYMQLILDRTLNKQSTMKIKLHDNEFAYIHHTLPRDENSPESQLQESYGLHRDKDVLFKDGTNLIGVINLTGKAEIIIGLSGKCMTSLKTTRDYTKNLIDGYIFHKIILNPGSFYCISGDVHHMVLCDDARSALVMRPLVKVKKSTV